MRPHLEACLRSEHGVISRRSHPELAGAVDSALRRGELVRVLPGVYAPPELASSVTGRARAAMLWDPDAVLVGRAAASLGFWTGLTVSTVELAGVGRRLAVPDFAVSRRIVPPELVLETGGVRLTTPALSALDLCAELGGDPIDVGLRSRRLRLVDLHRALELTPGRRGNRSRRRLLLDSRDEPWSEAERLAHRILRAAGIRGWRANYPVTVRGRRYYLDIAFPGARLVVEIDGRLHHGDPRAFEADRRRQNDLVLAGWRMLRFTWWMLRDDPAMVAAAVRSAL